MNENLNETHSHDEEAETFSAWMKRNRLDKGQPWLFYGEDESFEDYNWIIQINSSPVHYIIINDSIDSYIESCISRIFFALIGYI